MNDDFLLDNELTFEEKGLLAVMNKVIQSNIEQIDESIITKEDNENLYKISVDLHKKGYMKITLTPENKGGK